MKWRHSKWYGYRDRSWGPMCDCGHPECLHRRIVGYTTFPPEECRSKDCDGQCDQFSLHERAGP